MKTALITGITGQDGAYLAEFLLAKKYRVFGLYRRTSTPNFWRLLDRGIKDKVTLIPGDMTDMASLLNAVVQSKPHEIYNLAAQSFVMTSFDEPLETAAVDGLGVVMLLEAVRQIDPKIKVYHASTSELYGNDHQCGTALNETHSFHPSSPYAAAKLYSYQMVRIYREAYGMHVMNGILFNHESPLRGLEFVTRKITNSLVRIKLGLQKTVALGNLDAQRDWGYAKEYVEAMWRMLQLEKPDDYVIATGEKHSVKEFCEAACGILGLDANTVVVRDKKYYRPLDIEHLAGDASRARTALTWEPKTGFKELVQLMVDEDLRRWEDHLAGKIFPWDAMNDPGLY